MKIYRIYEYLFCYNDRENNFYFQVQYYSVKDVTLSKIEDFDYEFIPPIRDYDYLKFLFRENLIFEIEIDKNDKNLGFLSLTTGPKKGPKFWEANARMFQYAIEYGLQIYS